MDESFSFQNPWVVKVEALYGISISLFFDNTVLLFHESKNKSTFWAHSGMNMVFKSTLQTQKHVS